MNEVLTQATKKIAAIIQKTMTKNSKNKDVLNRTATGGMAMGELENLIRHSDL
jgi:hypothetical protein